MTEPASKTAAELVAEAKQRVTNLTVDDVAAERESGDPLIVDVREPAERDEHGSIPGAVSAPRGMLEFWADPSSPATARTNAVAAGGRSALAADTLQQLGYTDVAHLDGGFTAWKEAGQPTEGGA